MSHLSHRPPVQSRVVTARDSLFVRAATADDASTLRAFDEWNVVTAERIAGGECFAAGFADAAPLAYGILDRSFMGRRFVAILFVHPDHRHRGLGRALLAHFETVVTRDRPRDGKLWISTSIENLPMQRLLHQRSYVSAGVVDGLGRVPELFFYRELTA